MGLCHPVRHSREEACEYMHDTHILIYACTTHTYSYMHARHTHILIYVCTTHTHTHICMHDTHTYSYMYARHTHITYMYARHTHILIYVCTTHTHTHICMYMAGLNIELARCSSKKGVGKYIYGVATVSRID